MKKLSTSLRNVKNYISLPLINNCWYVAGLVKEFGREPIGRTLLEKSIVFYRTEAGELVALQNRCLHRSYPLSESKLNGDNIVCGYHGIEYSPQGEIMKIPCQTQCPNRKLRNYPTKELGPFVFIWMGDEERADESKLPDMPYLEEPDYLSIHGVKHVEGNYLMLHENLNDLSHFPFLHAATFGNAVNAIDDDFIDLPVEYEERNGIMGCYRIDENSERILLELSPEQVAAVGDRKLRKWYGGGTYSPGVFLGENFSSVNDPAPGQPEAYKRYLNHYMTPEKHDTFHYFYSVTMDYLKPNKENENAKGQLYSAAFQEDVVAVNHMQKLLDNEKSEFREINISADKVGMHFRHKMLEWVKEEYPDYDN